MHRNGQRIRKFGRSVEARHGQPSVAGDGKRSRAQGQHTMEWMSVSACEAHQP